MAQCRVIVEFSEASDRNVYMHWERGDAAANAGAFHLLGRAFEVCRRECEGDFQEALAAFLQGAMIQKEDIVEFLSRLESGKARKS